MDDNLNYKKAYYYLFNKLTDMNNDIEKLHRRMAIIQRNAEGICIAERENEGKKPKEEEIDTTEVLVSLVKEIKDNLDE